MSGITQARGLNAEHLGPGSNPFEARDFTAAFAQTPLVIAEAPAIVTAAASTADPALLRTIDWGTKIADAGTIKVWFAEKGATVNDGFDNITSLGWNAYEKQQVMLAFQQYENIIGVHVEVTTNKAEADFKLATDKIGGGILGYCNPPGEAAAGVGVFARNGFGWDEQGGGGLEQGGYGFITLTHEFGHGFGLAHPHDRGGTSTIMQGVTKSFGDFGDFDLNQGVFTVMSYNSGWETGPNGLSDTGDYGWEGTMTALDIAVLQAKYGANTNFHNSADTYVLADANQTGTMYACLWDTGGKDTIAYQGDRDCTIDLRGATLDYSPTGGGVVSYVDGIVGGYTIANGVVIEKAKGGSGDDVVTGNGGANILNGGAGRDVITSGGGKDLLVGGSGKDTFVFDELDSGSVASIRDYNFGTNAVARDLIDLSGIDANVNAAGMQHFDLVVGGFTGHAGEILLTQDSSTVLRMSLDVDGDGQSDMDILLRGYETGDVVHFTADSLVV